MFERLNSRRRKLLWRAFKRTRLNVDILRYIANRLRMLWHNKNKSTVVCHPTNAMIELGNVCNLHCLMCPREYQYGKQKILKPGMTFDEMINMIPIQDTAAHATIMNEAIRLMLFEKNITLSEEQKQKMKKSMEKYRNNGNTYFQNFGANSNDVALSLA